mgnify:CR=1 FL=1
MSFAISTDTSANLPTAELQWHQLYLLPFSYIVDDVEHQCLDLTAFDGDAYYEMLRHTPASTSMISMDQYRRLWEPLLQEGQDVLHVGMSSGISGAYAASESASKRVREENPNVRIETFDTRGASLGEGLLVRLAVQLRDAGKTAVQIAASLEHAKEHLHLVAAIDDLKYLRKGGRLPAAVAVAGGMLGIKPLITIKEGKVAMAGKARGLPGAYVALFKKVEELGGISAAVPALAGYTLSAREVQPIQTYLQDNLQCAEPLVRQIGCVIGTHAGPGAFGLAFFDQGLEL